MVGHILVRAASRLIHSVSSLYPYMVIVVRELSGISLKRALIPFIRVPLS